MFALGCARDDDEEECPALDCTSCGERVVWLSAPAANAAARTGDIVRVTVHARSAAGVATLGFVALGDLAGQPLQLAHETAAGGGQAEATAQFDLAVPFNGNLTRIVLVALAEDADGFLRSDVQSFAVEAYE